MASMLHVHTPLSLPLSSLLQGFICSDGTRQLCEWACVVRRGLPTTRRMSLEVDPLPQLKFLIIQPQLIDSLSAVSGGSFLLRHLTKPPRLQSLISYERIVICCFKLLSLEQAHLHIMVPMTQWASLGTSILCVSLLFVDRKKSKSYGLCREKEVLEAQAEEFYQPQCTGLAQWKNTNEILGQSNVCIFLLLLPCILCSNKSHP